MANLIFTKQRRSLKEYFNHNLNGIESKFGNTATQVVIEVFLEGSPLFGKNQIRHRGILLRNISSEYFYDFVFLVALVIRTAH
jgi:hypothetical protein